MSRRLLSQKAICLAGLCLLNATNAAASKTIVVYDVNHYHAQRMSHAAHVNYLLSMGAYHSRAYAEQRKRELSKKTHVPVRVVPAKHLQHTYFVFVGPFHDVNTMIRVGRQLGQSQPHVVIPRRQAVNTVPVVRVMPGWKDMPVSRVSYETGPYVGGSLGIQLNTTSTPTAYRGFDGTLSFGWGHLWTPRFYLAAEIFGSGDNDVLSNYKSSTTGNSARSSWSMGVDAIPGYMITDTVLAYARLGGVRSRFNAMGVEKNGWQVGFGGQTNVYKNLDLRAEYIYSLYTNIAGLGRPQVDQFNLGLVYQFDAA